MSSSLSLGWDHVGTIARTLGDLEGTSTVIHELIQNADDAPTVTSMVFTVSAERLTVWNDGEFAACADISTPECIWVAEKGHRCDFHSFRSLGSGDKRNRAGTTGAFGIGFTAVYQLTDHPELVSGVEHWVIDQMREPQDRINRRVLPSSTTGTTFHLPWATAQSAFRTAIGQERVTALQIESFFDELRAAVPRAMPFLKKLECIEIIEGEQTVTFDRVPRVDGIRITASTGEIFEWATLKGELDEATVELQAQHPDVIGRGRGRGVTVALPLGGNPLEGLLYATLPTEQSSHLPILIDADFVPASDRKRIRLDEDGAAGEWNRAAIRAAASTVATHLEQLPGLIGDEAVIRLLIGALGLSERTDVDRPDECFLRFWGECVAALAEAAIVPTESGRRQPTHAVRLWTDPAEAAAGPLLDEFGIELVHDAVKDKWFQIRRKQVSLEPLTLADVVAALVGANLSRRTDAGAMPTCLSTDARIEALWSLVEVLLSTQGRSNSASRQSFLGCAVVPAQDGSFSPIAELHRTDRGTVSMLGVLGVTPPMLDEDRIEPFCPSLISLVPEVTAISVVAWLESKITKSDQITEMSAMRALHWLALRRAGLTAAHKARIARLPIFPTERGMAPLAQLSLPGDFVDPIGISDLLRIDDDLRYFVKDLGATELTFATYCTKHAAPTVGTGSLPEERLRNLTQLLARRVSEVQDDTVVAASLRPLRLVPCRDGQWRAASDVYLDESVCDVVGSDAHIADIPVESAASHRALYQWLGAASEPRPHDVIDRARSLSRAPDDRAAAAAAILKHLHRVLADEPDRAEAEYGALKTIAWLPARDDRYSGFLPTGVFSEFRKTLFSSQAKFLDIPIGTQRDASDVLSWLGVQSEPEPKQVVDHLLWSAKRSKPVGQDMWIYLNNSADDPVIQRLSGQKCLLLAGANAYVAPNEVFWGNHQFGSYRHTLGSNFTQYQTLLTALGVSENPTALDGISVLGEIASSLDQDDGPVTRTDVDVIAECWRLIADGLAADELTPDQLAGLSHCRSVIDATGKLQKPTDLLFIDSPSLVAHFDAELRQRLIERPEQLWLGMATAGVRDLSDAVSTRMINRTKASKTVANLAHRLRDRRQPLLRVLGADDVHAGSTLDAFIDGCTFEPLAELTIEHTVEVNGTRFISSPFARGAFWVKEENAFLHVDTGGARPAWAETARELVRALGVDKSRAASTASAVKDVLGAGSAAEASRELDDLGFANLEGVEFGLVPSAIADGFGGAPVGPEPTEASQSDAVDQASDRQGAARGDDEDPAGTTSDSDSSAPAAISPAATDRSSAPSDTEDSTGTGQALVRRASSVTPARSSGTSRMRSYVAPRNAESADPHEIDEIDNSVERAGVSAVLEYERLHGREASEMPPGNVGYDIRSVSSSGELRIIEVKATRHIWGVRGVAISSAQFAAAQSRREEFWLYVVDDALGKAHVHPINDPASKIDQYFFDDGWSRSVEVELPRGRRVPELTLPTSAEGLEYPVPLCIPSDLELVETGMWVSSPVETVTFAIQIPGESLGLVARGGIAFVEPTTSEPDVDDTIAGLLHEQIDPDSGSTLTVRSWGLVDDSTAELMLSSVGDVEPIQVNDPARFRILGRVVGVLDLADLGEFGYV